MNRTLEDAWPEVSPYLDEILELGREERQARQDEIEARAPDIAAQLREYLITLSQLEEQDFLGSSPAAVLSEATLAGQSLGSYTLDKPLGQMTQSRSTSSFVRFLRSAFCTYSG